MVETIGKLFGGGTVQGPSAAEKAAQVDQRNKAVEQRAEADKLAALTAKLDSRRSSLKYKDTLGG